MSKPPALKNAAKEITLGYLRSLYYKKVYQEELTPDEATSVRNITKLSEYLSSHEEFKIFIRKPGPVTNESLECGKGGFTVISDPSFRNAMAELVERGLVKIKDGEIQYIPRKEEQEKMFPILKMADDIAISPLPWTDLAFYKVRRGLSIEVANYINQQFYSNDIYAVSLGDLVMCIDIAIPEHSSIVSKRKNIRDRIDECLSIFQLQELSSFSEQESKLGYTPEELAQQRMEISIEQQRTELEADSMYGGIIKGTAKRNIKKK